MKTEPTLPVVLQAQTEQKIERGLRDCTGAGMKYYLKPVQP